MVIIVSFVVPMAVGLATLSPPLVTLLYGEQWLPSSEPLRFLAVVMVVRLVTGLALDIQTSLGKTRTTVWVNLVWVPRSCRRSTWAPPRRDHRRGHGPRRSRRGGGGPAGRRCAAPQRREPAADRPALLRALVGGLVAAVVMLGLARAVGDSAVLEVLVAGTCGVLAYAALVVPGSLRRHILAGCGATPNGPPRDQPMPLVSVGLPVRNAEDRVATAIRSVLEQDHADLELVVSDNASTDGTEDVCRELARSDPRVRYVRQPLDLGILGNFRATLGSRRAPTSVGSATTTGSTRHT